MYPRKRALERIAREKVLYPRQPGGDISVCVIYPNIYRLGDGQSWLPGRVPYLRIRSVRRRRSRLHARCRRARRVSRRRRAPGLVRARPSALRLRHSRVLDFLRDRLSQCLERAADGRDSRSPRRPRGPQFSADHRRRFRRVSQSRTDRRFYRSVSDWRGRGDGPGVHRALGRDTRIAESTARARIRRRAHICPTSTRPFTTMPAASPR